MTALTPGAHINLDLLGLPGRWTVWSQAADSPGAYFVCPADEAAQAIAVKYAVIRAVMGRSAAQPALQLLRTDPHRTDLVEADKTRRDKEKHP